MIQEVIFTAGEACKIEAGHTTLYIQEGDTIETPKGAKFGETLTIKDSRGRLRFEIRTRPCVSLVIHELAHVKKADDESSVFSGASWEEP